MVFALLIVIYLVNFGYGFPESLLGAIWPFMYHDFAVSIASVSIISTLIAAFTAFSSLTCHKLAHRFGSPTVAVCGCFCIGLALFSYSFCTSFLSLCVLSCLYGLGAGVLDTTLNDYIARHYSNAYMNWLHCTWGLGGAVAPHVVSFALSHQFGWQGAYRIVGCLLMMLALLLLLCHPIWKKAEQQPKGTVLPNAEANTKPLSFFKLIQLPGVPFVVTAFIFDRALEQSLSLWSSSFLTFHANLPAADVAKVASIIFIGVTAGRFVSACLSTKIGNITLIRIGFLFTLLGVILLMCPLPPAYLMVPFLIIGLGSAPIYPSMMHCTPTFFGGSHSQAIIGIQTASSYAGCALSPVFGLLTTRFGIGVFPYYLLLSLLLLCISHCLLLRAVCPKTQ